MSIVASKSLFLQIADRISDGILSGAYPEESRIPSVREMAELMEVNPNTVARAYERLLLGEIVYTKRGVGYYVSPGAKEKVFSQRRETFFQKILPGIFDQMKLLDIEIEQVAKLWKQYYSNVEDSLPTDKPLQALTSFPYKPDSDDHIV